MSLKKYHVLSFFVVLIAGTFLHFTYEWSNFNKFVSYFSAVNESPWEHLKLLFWPAVFFGIYEYFAYGKKRADFFAVKMTAIISALVFILVFFYTYSGILGFNLLFLDLLDFVLGVFLYSYISCIMLSSALEGDLSDSVKGISVLVLLGTCFVIWTNNPPDLGVFWG